MRAVARCAPQSAGSHRKVTPPQLMRLRARRGRADARNECGCGRARGLGYEGYEGYEGLRECNAALCASGGGVGAWGALAAAAVAVALRGRARPPPGPVVPVWRLRSARATAACPSAPRSLRGCGARCGAQVTWATMGARCGAQNSERAARAALQLYQSIDVPLDCRSARRWYIPADGDALRSAISAALRPRRQLPSVSPR